MCYGKCDWEDRMGDCTLNWEDKKFLLEKYGFEYPCPEIDDDYETIKTINQDIWDHRDALEVMRVLTKGQSTFLTQEEAFNSAIENRDKFWFNRKSRKCKKITNSGM